MTGSDSESTEEPVVGNLNKFAVIPPNYTGRPKKGHLIFDACFESGMKSHYYTFFIIKLLFTNKIIRYCSKYKLN